MIPFTGNGSYTSHFTSVAPSLKLGFPLIASLPIVGFATVVADARTETRRVTELLAALLTSVCGCRARVSHSAQLCGPAGSTASSVTSGSKQQPRVWGCAGGRDPGQLQPARAWLPGLSSCSSSLGVHTRPGGCCQGSPWSRHCWPSRACMK